MRVLFAGGGTGGHINPAISIADYIKEREPDFQALFVGTKAGLETKLVPAAGYDIRYIDVQGFNRKKIYKNVKVVCKLLKSRSDCKKIIQEFQPDVVVCTGGYVSGPVCMAAHKLGIPSFIHEQNVYPGLTVKGAEKYVSKVAVSFDETVRHMGRPDKCVVTGNPVRKEILQADYARARKELGLPDKPFVLVFGGSLGADKINETMLGVLKYLQREQKFLLLFGTGDRNFEKITKAIKQEKIILPDTVKIVPYIDNMQQVMAAADVVVSRAGAITVSEIAALGKPSVLIPSPNVVRNHQEQNAREFEAKGAAAVLTEDILTPDGLYHQIVKMTEDRDGLEKMADNVRKLAKMDALDALYELVKKLAEA